VENRENKGENGCQRVGDLSNLNESDKILTLSTCNDTGTERVVLHAKMVNISYK